MASPQPRRWDIGEILERTDLATLLDEHTPARGEGHRRRWHCPAPDHHDRHPSVTMAADGHGHERWRCWSGDDTHRGDAIDLIMLTHRTDRAEAINYLAERAGLALTEPTTTRPPRRAITPPPPPPAGPVPLDDTVRRYVAACENVLWSRTGQPVREWLHQRGLADQTLRANHVGADPGRRLMHRAPGLPGGRSIAATFPALSAGGDVTYVQSRYLDPGEGPKYENPASKLGTNPRLAWTTTSGGPRSMLVVCEGIPDALTAAQLGIASAAVLGAQAPDAHVANQLIDHARAHGLDLVAVVDDDHAGHAWGQRLEALAADEGHILTVITPPDGHDLNSWALTEPRWPEALEQTSRVTLEPMVSEIGLELR